MTRVWQGSLVVALLVFVTVAVGGRGAAQDNEFAAQSEFIDPDATLKNAAGEGYVCKSVLVPNGRIPAMGTYGYISLQLRTAANCGGTLVVMPACFQMVPLTRIATPRISTVKPLSSAMPRCSSGRPTQGRKCSGTDAAPRKPVASSSFICVRTDLAHSARHALAG